MALGFIELQRLTERFVLVFAIATAKSRDPKYQGLAEKLLAAPLARRCQ